MSDGKNRRNEHPLWVDVAKYLIDNFGIDIGKRILHFIVPENARKWLRDNLSGSKGEAVLGSLSVGAARLIPDTRFGEIMEEAIREFASAVKHFIGDRDISFDEMPAEIREKGERVRQICELGHGLFSLQLEAAQAVSDWLYFVLLEKGGEFANKVVKLITRMSSVELEVFAGLSDADKTAYCEALFFEKSPKPSDGPSWLEKQRAGAADLCESIENEADKLREKKTERRERLGTAWKRVVGRTRP